MTVLRARLAYPDGADEEAWRRVAAFGARLPENLRGVFLYLGRAAVAGQPCPSDEDIARFFGSHSPGRARRMIDQLEQTEAIVARLDFRQRRIISFPELGLETSSHRAEASASGQAVFRAFVPAPEVL